MAEMTGRPGLVRFLQAALLTAAAVVGVAELDFGWFEVAVAMLGASVLAATGELALAPSVEQQRPEAPPIVGRQVRWDVGELVRRAEALVGRDRVRDDQRAHLLAKLRTFAGEDGRLPLDLDELVRESFPELIDP